MKHKVLAIDLQLTGLTVKGYKLAYEFNDWHYSADRNGMPIIDISDYVECDKLFAMEKEDSDDVHEMQLEYLTQCVFEYLLQEEGISEEDCKITFGKVEIVIDRNKSHLWYLT